jgi:uncharacterized membrane protein YedE/YeeE
MTPLEQIVSLVQAGHWLPVILLTTMIVRKWVSSDSKFPISIPKTWQPTITAAGGLVYGLELAIQQGQPIGAALLGMAVAAGAGGFLDGILVAIFDHDNAPVWARSIVFIFDDLTGQTPVSGAARDRLMKSVRPPPLPSAVAQPEIPITVKKSEPPKSARSAWNDLYFGDIFCVLGVVLVCTRCSATPVPAGSPVDVGVQTAVCVLRVAAEDDLAGMKPEAIVLDCIAKCGATSAQVTLVREQYAASRALEHKTDGGK